MGGSVNATFETIKGASLTFGWMEEAFGYLVPLLYTAETELKTLLSNPRHQYLNSPSLVKC
jgi:hypothetical protein